MSQIREIKQPMITPTCSPHQPMPQQPTPAHAPAADKAALCRAAALCAANLPVQLTAGCVAPSYSSDVTAVVRQAIFYRMSIIRHLTVSRRCCGLGPNSHWNIACCYRNSSKEKNLKIIFQSIFFQPFYFFVFGKN